MANNPGYGGAAAANAIMPVTPSPWVPMWQQQQQQQYDEHFTFMEAREYLPEFRGQIPMRKKPAGVAPATATVDAISESVTALKLSDATLSGADTADTVTVAGGGDAKAAKSNVRFFLDVITYFLGFY